jgi:glycerol-3-phosphate dehydrogenase
MALTLADAVLRRLDLGTAGPPDEADLEVVCRTMRAELLWDAARERRERDELRARYPRS